MNTHVRAYTISTGIHALVLSSVLALGLITPRTKALVLDFSITNAPKGGQDATLPATRQRSAAYPQRNVTQTAQEEAVPVKKEQPDEAPRPVPEQPRTAAAAAEGSDGRTSSLGSEGAVTEAFIAAHFRSIRDKILRNLSYPPIARKMGWAGKVSVAFTVCADGSVEDVSVIESSGFSVLDRDAIKAIKNSCPLPKPPMKTALIMPVVYRLE